MQEWSEKRKRRNRIDATNLILRNSLFVPLERIPYNLMLFEYVVVVVPSLLFTPLGLSYPELYARTSRALSPSRLHIFVRLSICSSRRYGCFI